MRYSGQSHNLVIAVPEKIRRDESLSALAEAFHRAHEAIYSFRESDDVVEIVTQRLSILGETPEISFPKIPRSAGAVTPIGRRTIFLEDRYVGADIFSRRSLGAGSSISGCAIVEENDLTLLVPSGWNVSADEHGILMIEREARNAA
jgi:N-methylhydantoinase A